MQIFGIEILGSQLILSIVILFILIKTWNSYRAKKMSTSFSIFWVMFWSAALFVIFYPGFLTKIANILNIGRGVDFALYVSIILLFYSVYKLNIKIGKLNRDLTKIVRKIAIKRIKIGK